MIWLAGAPMLSMPVPSTSPAPYVPPTPSDLWWAGYWAGFWVMFWIALIVAAAFLLGLAIGKGWIHAPQSIAVPGWVTRSGKPNT